MSDQWAWWREALAGRIGPMQEAKLESGFYRHFRGDPVAIWRDAEGALTMLRDGNRMEHELAQQATWIECAKKPVTRDAYNARRSSGNWNGQQEPAAEAPAPAAPARSNVSTDPYQALMGEIADKLGSVQAWLKAHPQATTAGDSDYARNLQAELLALNRRADALHKAEKAPVLEQSRTVDERFRVRETVAGEAAKLRAVFEQFMVAEEARRAAAAKVRFEAARAEAEAERKRILAEREKLRQDDPIAALTSPEPALPPLPAGPEPVKVTAGGDFGRAAGLKSEWIAEITNPGATLGHFAKHPEVLALIAKLADKAVKAAKGDIDIPGVKVVERRRAA